MSELPLVLYVEDDPGSRKILQIILRPYARVTLFEDSVNFRARVEALNPAPEVILLDIHVKPSSGFEMLAMLKTMPQFESTPIVALTASVMNEEVDQLHTAGFHSVIAKPLDMDTFPDLLQRIRNGEQIWRIVG